jgi:hypothetical protein
MGIVSKGAPGRQDGLYPEREMEGRAPIQIRDNNRKKRVKIKRRLGALRAVVPIGSKTRDNQQLPQAAWYAH